MPTYEFRCPNGHVFDKFFRSIGAAQAEFPCPECGELAARQISGGAGLQFKGSGFYLTDYGKNAHRGSGPTARSSKSGSSESAPASDSKSGGEGKPAGESPATPSKPSSSDKD